MSKKIMAILLALLALSFNAQADIVRGYPLLERLQYSGQKLSKDTLEWMTKWQGMDLENSNLYLLNEFAGKSSINLKIKLIDSSSSDGSKSRGSFVTRNSSANFDLEVAYFHMAALLGMDRIIRPAIPYQLGPTAMNQFKSLMEKTSFADPHRNANKVSILERMTRGAPLYGCLKAKSKDTELEYEALGANEKPILTHPVFQALQASNPLPRSHNLITLAPDYTGNLLKLAREFSVILILDTIFQQWDRYSGGNISLSLDSQNEAHFYFSDNGGGIVNEGTDWISEYLTWFSRYDRTAIERLKDIHYFLLNPSTGYLGYTSAETFVQDLGLLTERTPSDYAALLTRNIGLVLDKVRENEARYGSSIYLD